jgi:hypothetical protein
MYYDKDSNGDIECVRECPKDSFVDKGTFCVRCPKNSHRKADISNSILGKELSKIYIGLKVSKN